MAYDPVDQELTPMNYSPGDFCTDLHPDVERELENEQHMLAAQKLALNCLIDMTLPKTGKKRTTAKLFSEVDQTGIEICNDVISLLENFRDRDDISINGIRNRSLHIGN